MSNDFLSKIRPRSFADFFGQKQIIDELKVYIFSAKKQKTCLDHMLFIGPSGMGKTSLSYVISEEMYHIVGLVEHQGCRHVLFQEAGIDALHLIFLHLRS